MLFLSDKIEIIRKIKKSSYGMTLIHDFEDHFHLLFFNFQPKTISYFKTKDPLKKRLTQCTNQVLYNYYREQAWDLTALVIRLCLSCYDNYSSFPRILEKIKNLIKDKFVKNIPFCFVFADSFLDRTSHLEHLEYLLCWSNLCWQIRCKFLLRCALTLLLAWRSLILICLLLHR